MRAGRRRATGPIGADEFDRAFLPLYDAPAPWLVAVSGGPDSTALMHALAGWARRRDLARPVVATVDHGLRPGSRTEADAVAASARELGLAHHILTWIEAPRTRSVSQAAARGARYHLLRELATSLAATAVVTAHTLDDQAETILMRLAAGSGLSGLGAMSAEAERDGTRILRPFLDFPKARLVATCRAEGWRFVDDPSNGDDRFARVRWRRLMPVLSDEGLDATTLARFARRARRADAALDAAAAAAFDRARRPDGGLAAATLFAEPDEIGLRVLARAIAPSPDVAAVPDQIRLARLEACHHEFECAHRDGRLLRRTLAGQVLTLDNSGLLTIRPEGRRRRGAPAGREGLLTPFVAGRPPSLGIAGPRA